MFIKLYALTLPILLACDMVWLTIVAKKFYQTHIGFMMKPEPTWWAGLFFYLVYAAALVVFVTLPALEKHRWQQALLMGAFFGFTCYAAYDLTSQATTKNWPLIITIVDLTWGTLLSAAVATAVFFLGEKFIQ
jgi:uncharacterized membrane protein